MTSLKPIVNSNLKMKRKLFTFWILAVTISASFGQKIDFEEYDLENGLHVILTSRQYSSCSNYISNV